MKLRTLTRKISIGGIGLHSGTHSHVTFVPSDRPGIVFKQRGEFIPATVENVVDTTRGTTLGANGSAVKTVEHLLAAVFWLGLRHVEIEVDGEEIPVLDGSALPWFNLLKPHVSETSERFKELAISEPIEISDGFARVKVTPADALFVSYTIDYPGTPIGVQTWKGTVTPDHFETELAPARTFGFMEEVKSLRERGLAQGGNLENCVVIDRNAILTPLRFGDEMVRHKVLDLMGDLALVGLVPKARVEIHKGSHRLHVALAVALKLSVKAG